LQKNYKQPNYNPDVLGLAKFNLNRSSLSRTQNQIIDGALICGYGKERYRVFGDGTSTRVDARLFTLENARFAHKIAAIDSVKFQCKRLLKYLIEEQMQIYKERLDDGLPVMPRPHNREIFKNCRQKANPTCNG
jgi:hypothetical protein